MEDISLEELEEDFNDDLELDQSHLIFFLCGDLDLDLDLERDLFDLCDFGSDLCLDVRDDEDATGELDLHRRDLCLRLDFVLCLEEKNLQHNV